jgi:uncharacterized protein (DUF2147 family)
MLRILSFRLLMVMMLGVVTPLFSYAQADPLEGFWFNDTKHAKIQVYKGKDNKLYGKIVWMAEPNRNGKPKMDEKNPDESKRTQPVIGLVILKGFKQTAPNLYEDGTIYDPKNGKTYSCKITKKGDELDVRGFVGISLIGRSTKWTRAD